MPGLLLAIAFWSQSLHAQPAPSPIYVTLRLAPECQGASNFAERLLSRTHRLRRANPGEPGIVFDIAARPFQTGFVGQLQIQELDGRYTQRSVEGATCDGVINALAFVAAVLVDPEAAQRVAPPAAPPAPELPPIPPTPGVPAVFNWGIGVTSGFTYGTASNRQLNLGGLVIARWHGSKFSPWVAVGWDYRFPNQTQLTLNPSQEQAHASIGGWTAYGTFTSLRFIDTNNFTLRPELRFEAGRLSASNVSPSNGQNHGGLWIGWGGGLNAEFRVYGTYALFADGGVVMPVSYPSFYFDKTLAHSSYYDFYAHVGMMIVLK